MNDYAILIGLTTFVDLGEDADRDKSRRLCAIYEHLFAFGPAWHGNQGSVLLKTDLLREEIIERLSPLVGDGDFLAVMEIATKSITTVGYNADEEGLDALYPDVAKLLVARDGGTYRKS